RRNSSGSSTNLNSGLPPEREREFGRVAHSRPIAPQRPELPAELAERREGPCSPGVVVLTHIDTEHGSPAAWRWTSAVSCLTKAQDMKMAGRGSAASQRRSCDEMAAHNITER